KGPDMNEVQIIKLVPREAWGLEPGSRVAGQRILVVALDAASVPRIDAGADVLVVAPALNTRLKRWLSDEDGAIRQAEDRVVSFTSRLSGAGACVEGRVGDGDPLQSIADALRTFRADEIVIAGEPEGSARPADELMSRALDAFGLPVSVGRRPRLQAA